MRQSIPVQKMMCESCCETISSELSKLEAITNIETNLSDKTVSFDYREDSDLNMVKQRLTSLGYCPATISTTTESKPNSLFTRITKRFSK